MTRGAPSKRCGCRDPKTRKQLGAKCPKLRRKDGSWNPRHGTYRYQLDLPPAPDGSRRLLRRAGFSTRDDAQADRDRVRWLIRSAGSDRAAVEDVVAQILAVRAGQDMPDVNDVDRRRRIGADDGRPATVGYLRRWLRQLDVNEPLLHRYRAHCELYLIPMLGEIAVTDLTDEHVRAAMEAIRKNVDNVGGAGLRGRPPEGGDGRRRVQLPPEVYDQIRDTLSSAMDAAITEGVAGTKPVPGWRLLGNQPPDFRRSDRTDK